MIESTTASVDLAPAAKRRLLSPRAGIQRYISLTIPIRFGYALDRARYAVACDTEACDHYGLDLDKGWQLRLAAAAYTKGLFEPQIPADFMERWFSGQGGATESACPKMPGSVDIGP